VNRRLVFLLLFAYFLVMTIAAAGYWAYWQVFEKPPAQPIAFSHKTHVLTAGLNCEFCHEYADRAAMPSIPSVSKCMSCHINVKVNSPEIIKLTQYWKDRQPVPWNKVHSFAPRKHVGFKHKPHLKAKTLQQYVEYVPVASVQGATGERAIAAAMPGGATLETRHEQLCGLCHGEVRGMDQMRQVRSLKMGWCIDCHSHNEASIDCLTCHK